MQYKFYICYNEKRVHKNFKEVIMKKYINDLAKQNDEFQEIIKPLITNETVLQIKNFRQHY